MLQENYVYSRFIRIILPLCLLAFLSTIATYEFLIFKKELRDLESKLNKLTSTYSLLYAEPIALDHEKELRAFTISLLSDPDTALVVVRDGARRTLDEFTAVGDSKQILSKTIGINYATETGYSRIGELTLGLSKKSLFDNLRTRLIGDLILIVVLITAVMLSIWIAFRSSIVRSLKVLAHQASHDALTNLINRRAYEQLLEHVIRDRRSAGGSHMLLYLDLDNFKLVNDRDGHHAGDIALKKVAELLKTCVREEDFVARLGGDEFSILLANCNIDDAMAISGKICRSIRLARISGSHEGHAVGVSIGVAKIDDHDLGVVDYLKRADAACYAAKRRGRNRVELYDEDDTSIPRVMPSLRGGERQGVGDKKAS